MANGYSWGVRISDVEDLRGKVPEVFKKCFVPECDRDAIYILCAVSDFPKNLEDRAFGDAAAEALAQELRAEFDTNLELPACELHVDGCTPAIKQMPSDGTSTGASRSDANKLIR